MNKTLLLISGFLLSFYCHSQHIYGGLGATMTSIDYKNSNGKSLGDLEPVNTNYYHVGMRDKANGNRTMFYRIGVTYTEYSAETNVNQLQTDYNKFDTSFLGLELGIDSMIFKAGDNFILFFSGFLSPELLMDGTQTTNLAVSDLNENEDFNNFNLFAKGGLTIQVKISKKIALIAEGKYGISVLNDFNKNETLMMKPLQFGLGFFMNLSSCSCNSF